MSVEINNIILSNNLDGYILPKNDNYFTEYSKINNLKSITNFSGSAGFAIFLKNKKYLFVDGRYTIQAEKEVDKEFRICEIPYLWPKDILKKKIKNIYLLMEDILFKLKKRLEKNLKFAKFPIFGLRIF